MREIYSNSLYKGSAKFSKDLIVVRKGSVKIYGTFDPEKIKNLNPPPLLLSHDLLNRKVKDKVNIVTGNVW